MYKKGGLRMRAQHATFPDGGYALEASGKDDETVAASPFPDLPITLTTLWE